MMGLSLQEIVLQRNVLHYADTEHACMSAMETNDFCTTLWCRRMRLEECSAYPVEGKSSLKGVVLDAICNAGLHDTS